MKLLNKDMRFMVNRWTLNTSLHIIASKHRKTKLGDFKVIENVAYISVNKNLPTYLLFFVLTHEIAHLICYLRYKRTVKPHGKEWKSIFSTLIDESIHCYSGEFHKQLRGFQQAPRASFQSNVGFLDYENLVSKGCLYLKDLPNQKSFLFNHQIYIKESKLKIRYICIHKKSKKRYSIHGLAEVLPIED